MVAAADGNFAAAMGFGRGIAMQQRSCASLATTSTGQESIMFLTILNP